MKGCETVRERIQRLVDLGVTRTAICKGTGLDNSMITRWLKGERDLKEANERKIAAWLEEFKKQVSEI